MWNDPPSISTNLSLTSTGKPTNTSPSHTTTYNKPITTSCTGTFMTTTPPVRAPFNRLLLTGAAGGLGKVLRERLRPYANVIRLSDIAAMTPAIDDREEVVPCDLADKQAVHQLVEGV